MLPSGDNRHDFIQDIGHVSVADRAGCVNGNNNFQHLLVLLTGKVESLRLTAVQARARFVLACGDGAYILLQNGLPAELRRFIQHLHLLPE